MKIIPSVITASLIAGIVIPVSMTCGQKAPETITIGFIMPLSGNIASWGESGKRATEIALEDINAAGGIRGKKVVVIYEDDKGDPRIAVTAYKKLSQVDKVPIVVGLTKSNETMAVAPMANKDQVVILSSGSSAAVVATAGPYIFRILPSDDIQAAMVADWALELGLKKVGVLYEVSTWHKGHMESFTKVFPAKGGTIAIIESADPGATDFRTQLTKIKSADVDAIFIPMYPKSVGLVAKQAREMGMKQQFFSVSTCDGPELVAAGGSTVEGLCYPMMSAYPDSPEYKNFAAKLKQKYNNNVDAIATFQYDVMLLALNAMKSIPADKAISGPQIRESLLKMNDFHGVSGVLTFNGKNCPEDRTFDRKTVINGKLVLYQKVKK
ncbi:MAG: penicillin-binding protein activator [Chitinispirillaceae bacterium]|nr:penicillin-binding protein activator [Chitinispirillaceae bacterium]